MPLDRRIRYIQLRCGGTVRLGEFARNYVALARFNGCDFGDNLLRSMKKAFGEYGRVWHDEPDSHIYMATSFAHGKEAEVC